MAREKGGERNMVSERLAKCKRFLSPYDRLVLETVAGMGGFTNAHTHLDRADTLNDIYLAHINTTPLEASGLPLTVKQNLTGDLHRGLAYTEKDLRARMQKVLERLVVFGTTSVTTCIDTTSDIGENGLLAFRVAKELKQEFAGRIDISVGPNPIFGFKKGTDRWDIFVAAAEQADFLSALPEKDDCSGRPGHDGRVGFRTHIRMVMELARRLKKEVHFHLDQANDPTEMGTEILLEGLNEWIDQPKIPGHLGPVVWVIHMISPSAYSEDRFARLVQSLLDKNVGVIVCPSAAISMRQLRPVCTPIHNSIARVLELCKMGVPVRMGTDNICDLFVPQCSGDMLAEIVMSGHGVRFATPYVWAKLAAGIALNRVDMATAGRVLYQDRKVFQTIKPGWQPAVD